MWRFWPLMLIVALLILFTFYLGSNTTGGVVAGTNASFVYTGPEQIVFSESLTIDLSQYFNDTGLTYLATDVSGASVSIAGDILSLETNASLDSYDIVVYASKGDEFLSVPLTLVVDVTEDATALAVPFSEVSFTAEDQLGAPLAVDIDSETRSLSYSHQPLDLVGVESHSLLLDVTPFSSSIVARFGRSPQTELTTDVFAVDDVTVSSAELSLAKYGNVDTIWHCPDFDVSAFSCPQWVVSSIPFEDNGTHITFTVDSFSAYAGGTALEEITASTSDFSASVNVNACGVLTQDSTLTQNVQDVGTCFQVQASHITIDCQGFIVGYDQSDTHNGYAFNVTDREGITIKNCDIRDLSITGTSDYGMELSRTNNTRIIDNKITLNSSLTLVGIRFINRVHNNTIANNSITGNSPTSGGQGIYITQNSYNNTITDNNISLNVSNGGIGIFLQSTFANSTIKDNNITIVSRGSTNMGIRLGGPGETNLISGNHIRMNGSGSGNTGISIDTGSVNNTILNNTIHTHGSGAAGYGIQVSSAGSFRSVSNRIIGNKIITNMSSSGTGIIMGAHINHTLIANNTIQTNSGQGSHALLLQNFDFHNIITGNNFTVNQTTGSTHGIYLQTKVANNTLQGNRLTLHSSGVNSYAIRADASGNNTFNSTILSTPGKWFYTDGNGELNITNITMGDPNGSIQIFDNFLVPKNARVDRGKFNFTNNTVYLNSSNLTFMNRSARVTLNQITASNPDPLVDYEDDGTYVACNPPDCIEESFIGNTYVFNVSHFTGFSTLEGPLDCGILTENVTLAQNVSSTGTCFDVQANDLTLDCAGNSITYATTATSRAYGVNITGVTNASVHNCTFLHTGSSVLHFSIHASSSGNNTITDNRFNLSSNARAVNLETSSYNSVERNLAYTSSGGGTFYIGTGSNNNTIKDNNASTGSTSSYVIETDFNTIFNNTGVSTGSSSTYFVFGNNNTFIENNATANTGSPFDISGADGNTFIRNKARQTISGSSFRVYSGSDHNELFDNFIPSNAGGGGVSIQTSSHDNEVRNTSSTSVAIGVVSSSRRNLIIENHVPQILMQSAFDNIFINNTITSLAVQSGSDNNTFINTTLGNLTSPKSLSLNLQTASLNNTYINTTLLSPLANWMTSASFGNATFKGITFENQQGSIRIDDEFIFPNGRTVSQSVLNITSNRAYLNSTNLSFLNNSGRIRLTNVNLVAPKVQVDYEDDGTFVDCPASDCTPLSYVGSTFTFNVSHFTSFQAAANPLIPLLNSTSGTNETDENLTLTLSGGEGSGSKNITNWYVNGTTYPVLNMPFESTGTQDTIAIDYSPNQTNGTVSGAIFNNGSRLDGFGWYHFDGINDVINVGPDPEWNFSESFSVSLWFNSSDINANGRAPIGRGGGFYDWTVWQSGATTSDTIAIYIRHLNNTIISAGCGAANGAWYSNGDWMHFVGVFDRNAAGNRLVSYVNGSLCGSALLADEPIQETPSQQITIGRLGTASHFVGGIDEVLVFKDPLTQDQAKELYNQRATIVSGQTEVGDVWHASVVQNDGTSDGVATLSNNLTVLADTGTAVTSCGTISGDAYLTTDITSARTCLFVTGSDLTLDCDGFSIGYDSSGLGTAHGINVTGNNVLIKDCLIRDESTAGGGSSDAISLRFVNNTVIFNNTILSNNTLNAFGVAVRGGIGTLIDRNTIDSYSSTSSSPVYINGAINTTVVNNTLTARGTANGNVGLWIPGGSNRTHLINNSLRVFGSSSNYGIYIQTDASHAIIRNNIISVNGTSGNNWGIYSLIGFNHTIEDNTIIPYGKSTANYGIRFVDTINTTIKNNLIQTNSSTTNNHGLFLTTTNNSQVFNNTIITNGSDSNYGLFFVSSSLNTVHNNTIITNTSGTNNYGIYSSSSHNNTYLQNNASTSGTTNNYALYLLNSRDNLAYQNRLLTNGSGSFNYATYIQTGSFNTLQDNLIRSFGLNNNYGLYIFTTANTNTITNNHITTNGTGVRQYGIILQTSTLNNTLKDNIITTYSGDTNYGIFLFTDADQNLAYNNTIVTHGTINNHPVRIQDAINNSIVNNTLIANTTSNNNFGILLNSNAYSNLVENNTISTQGTSQNYGINLQSLVHENTIKRNTIRAGGSSAFNIGINIQTIVRNNTITHNTIHTNGTVDNWAISLSTTSNDNVIAHNFFNTTGTSSEVISIVTGNHSFVNNTLAHNTTEWIVISNSNTDKSNFTRTTFLTESGSINIINTTYLFNTTVDTSNLNISFNKAYLNSSNLTTLNTSAQIFIRNLTFATASVQVDYEDDGTFVDCNAPDCIIDNYDGENLTFNVSHFTSFQASGFAAINTCRELTTDAVLTADILSNGTCINITANNVELDCAGYTIRHSLGGTSNTEGVKATTRSGIVIRNCIIEDSNSAGTNSEGIDLTSSADSRVINNTIYTNGTSNSVGIQLNNAADMEIVNNSIHVEASSNPAGINLGTRSNITQNIITVVNSGTFGYGIQTGDYSRITNNNISIQTTSGVESYAIKGNDGNVILRNNISNVGSTKNDYGIFVNPDSNYLISENLIRIPSGTGILLRGLAAVNITVRNNTVVSSSSSFAAIDSMRNGTISHNIFNSSGYGININPGVGAPQDFVFINNTIQEGPDASDYAIGLQGGNHTLIDQINSIDSLNLGSGELTIIQTNLTTVSFLGGTSGTTKSLHQYLNFSNNRTFINSSALTFLNRSATITHTGIAAVQNVLVDFDDNGVFDFCQTPQCINVSYNPGAGEFVFNVSSFTTYLSTNLSETTCGVLTSSTTLINDVSSNDTCFSIRNDNITLDCAGHTISYGGAGANNHYGINITGSNNITIKNCVIRDINESGANGIGIVVSSFSNNTLLYNNTIQTNGTNDNYGTWVQTSTNTKLIQNQFMTQGSAEDNWGAYLNGAEDSVLENNTIQTNGTLRSYGIYLSAGADNATIINNTLKTNGTQNNYGFYIASSSTGLIRENTVFTGGFASNSGNYGMRIHASNNWDIIRNNITTDGTRDNYAIRSTSSSSHNLVEDNTLITHGAQNNYVVDMNGGRNYTFFNNTLRGNGSTSNNGFRLIGQSDHNKFLDNRIVLKGVSSNLGIYLASSSNNTISRNTFDGQTTFNSNYGVHFTGGSLNNSFSENNITTRGLDSNYGIRSDARGNNSFVNNTITTNGTNNNYGIFVSDFTHNIIANNTIFTNTRGFDNRGIYLRTTDFNQVYGNSIRTQGNQRNHGLFVERSDHTTLHNNIFNLNQSESQKGIFLYKSTGFNLTNNTVLAKGFNAFALFIDNANATFVNTTVLNSTDWIKLNNSYVNFTKTLLHDTNGTITFESQVVASNISVTHRNLNFSTNRIFLNSTNITAFNTTSTIQLYDISLTNPKVQFDENDDGTFEDCQLPTCQKIRYAGGTFTFNVTHFSAFQAAEGSTGNLSCVFREDNTTCDAGYTKVYGMSNLTNAHAELANGSSYNVSVCCRDLSGTNTLTSASGFNLLDLSNYTDAHAELPNETNYNFPVSLGADVEDVSCIYPETNGFCNSNYACLGTLSTTLSANTSNLHVADCTTDPYATSVCCQFVDSATGPPSTCGTITENTTLNRDISSNGSCIYFGADDIELDCAGYTINYSYENLGVGITASGRRNITIKNCNLIQINGSLSQANGIYLNRTNESTVKNITANLSSASRAFHGFRSYFNTYDTLVVNSSSSFTFTIEASDNNNLSNINSTSGSSIALLITGSDSNIITNVTGRSNGGSNGVFVSQSLSNIITNAKARSATGTPFFTHFSDGNRYNHLEIETNTATPLQVDTSSDNNIFANTVLRANASWILITNAAPSNNIFVNTSFENVTSGRINITGRITLPSNTRIGLRNLSISKNKAFLNSTALPFFNTNATIVLNGLDPFTIILKDEGDNGSTLACIEPDCVLLSNDGTSATFTVTNFTTYSTANNTAPDLSNAFITTTSGFNLTADNLTVIANVTDADGHEIKNITNWYVNGTSITVLNLPFDGGSTNGTNGFTKDYSPYDNDGVVNATFAYSGGYDGFGAYEFDGIDDIINLGTQAELQQLGTADYAYSVWFKKADLLPQNGILLGSSTNTGTTLDRSFIWEVANGSMQFCTGDGGLNAVCANTGNITNSTTWHHMVAQRASGVIYTYVDGIFQDSQVANHNLNDISSHRFTIGASYFNGGSNFFNGTIDDVQIYNRSLSAEQISALYERQSQVIVSNETVVDDVWFANVTANDKLNDSFSVLTQNVSIILNAATFISGVGPFNITEDTNLNGDINCTGECINITADGITLDCNGNDIRYDQAGTGAKGITVFGRIDVTIKDCDLQDVNLSGTSGYGIELVRTNDTVIFNNTIYTNSTNESKAIHADHSSQIEILRNTIITNGTGRNNTAIEFDSIIGRSDHLLLINNTLIVDSPWGNSMGILLKRNTTNATVINNTITGNRGGASGTRDNQVLTFQDGIHNSTVEHNTMIGAAGSQGFIGFASEYWSTALVSKGNLVANNIIREIGGTGFTVGVYVEGEKNSSFVNNSITINGSGTTNGGFWFWSAQNTSRNEDIVIARNNISITSANKGHGIKNEAGRRFLITANRIETYGNNNNFGISLTHPFNSQNNVTDNIIKTNGSTSHGLRSQYTIGGYNLFYNNTISTNGPGSFGIWVNNATGAQFVNVSLLNVTQWISVGANSNINISNTTFGTPQGHILYYQTVPINTPLTVNTSVLNISQNKAYVDSLTLSAFDIPAQIQLDNIPSYQFIFFEENNDVEPRVCVSPRCIVQSFAVNTLIFNVSDWTNYTTGNNTPSNLTNVTLNATTVLNLTEHNLTAHIVNLTDTDGDPVKNITNWYVDGESLTVLNLPFEANSTSGIGLNNGTTKDYSAQDNPAFVVNATFNSTGGHDGFGAYEFDGLTLGFIEVPDNDALDIGIHDFTFEAWARFNSPTNNHTIFSKREELGANDPGYNFVHINTLDLRMLQIENLSGSDSLRCNAQRTAVLDGDWHHFIATRRGTTQEAYVDGTLCNSTVLPLRNGDNAASFNVGVIRKSGTVQPRELHTMINGSIDTVRIWNRSLSAAQIAVLAQGRDDLIVSDETNLGETWFVNVTPNDGIQDGISVLSNNVTIIDPVPSINATKLNSTTNLNLSRDNLTLYVYNASDADRDTIKNVTNWYVDDESFTVLHMPFEGGSTSGGLLVDGVTKDYAGGPNNGSVANATWNGSAGVDGFGAYEFNGNNSFIKVAHSSTLDFSSTNITVSAWIYPIENGQFGAIVDKDDFAGAGRVFQLKRASSNVVTFGLFNSSGTPVAATSAVFAPINTWSHVVGTYNGSVVAIFVNGALSATSAHGGAIASGTNPLFIGKNSASAGVEEITIPFNGTIDEVLVFNRSLDGDMVRSLYLNGLSRITGSETRVGETWYANITPNDGVQDGVSVSSNNLTILPDPVPSVFNIIPVNSSVFEVFSTIEIGANVTDELAVGTVLANLTLGNGTSQLLTLTLATGSFYNTSYTLPNVSGTYNVTIIANNTLGQVNNTESIFFTATLVPINPSITVTKTENADPLVAISQINYTITISNVGPGNATNVTIVETYPVNTTFIASIPAPITADNRTFFVGNLSPGASTTVNITLNLTNPNFSQTLVNTLNVSFLNFTNESNVVNTSATTSYSPTAAGGGAGGAPTSTNRGGGGGSGGGISWGNRSTYVEPAIPEPIVFPEREPIVEEPEVESEPETDDGGERHEEQEKAEPVEQNGEHETPVQVEPVTETPAAIIWLRETADTIGEQITVYSTEALSVLGSSLMWLAGSLWALLLATWWYLLIALLVASLLVGAGAAVRRVQERHIIDHSLGVKTPGLDSFDSVSLIKEKKVKPKKAVKKVTVEKPKPVKKVKKGPRLFAWLKPKARKHKPLPTPPVRKKVKKVKPTKEKVVKKSPKRAKPFFASLFGPKKRHPKTPHQKREPAPAPKKIKPKKVIEKPKAPRKGLFATWKERRAHRLSYRGFKKGKEQLGGSLKLDTDIHIDAKLRKSVNTDLNLDTSSIKITKRSPKNKRRSKRR